MKNENSNRRQVVAAAITASILTLIFGLTYYNLSGRLAAPVHNFKIIPEALEQLPMDITNWTGENLQMDEAVVRATGTDTHINRLYSRKNGMESITLFVGCSVSVFEKAIHRPEICYMRSGWSLMNRRSSVLSLDNGIKLPYSLFQFFRGDLDRQESLVIHYYIVDGQYYEEVTPLQAKMWRLGGTADYIARVMIAAPIRTSTAETAERLVYAFAIDSASSIAALFEHIRNEQLANSTDPPKKESSS